MIISLRDMIIVIFKVMISMTIMLHSIPMQRLLYSNLNMSVYRYNNLYLSYLTMYSHKDSLKFRKTILFI